jgi:hypothetical protein
MMSTTNNLNLNLFAIGVDRDTSFEQYQSNLNGISDSNMILFDNFSDLLTGSIVNLASSSSGSLNSISNTLSGYWPTLASIASASAIISGCFVKIGSFSGSGQANFSSIPATYTNLLIVGRGIANISGSQIISDISLDFNGDSGSSSYFSIQWESSGSSTGSYGSAFTTDSPSSLINIGKILAQAATFYDTMFLALIPNYSSGSGLYKAALGFSTGTFLSGFNPWWLMASFQGGTWINADAINRIRVFPSQGTSTRMDFQYSEIAVYAFK